MNKQQRVGRGGQGLGTDHPDATETGHSKATHPLVLPPQPSPPPASPLTPALARTPRRLTLLDHPSAGRRGVLHHLLHKDAIIPLGDGQPVGAAALPVGQQQLPGRLLLFLHLFGITKQSSGQWGWKAMGG